MRSNVTKVVLFFVIATIIVAYVLGLLFADIFAWTRVVDSRIMGEVFTLSNLCGASIAIVLGFYLGFINKKSRTYIENVVNEIDKVAWPTWDQTRVATVTVIVTSCIAALVLGVFDMFFGWLSRNNLFLR